jgi:hypothetical protein
MLLCFGVAGNTGCSMLIWQKEKSQFDTTALKEAGYDVKSLSSISAAAAVPPSSTPSIVLEVYNNGRHMERIPLPSERPWFVQDLVNEAEIQKRIGVTDIQIVRSVASQGPPLVLDVGVSVDGKMVNEGQNYSLCPGDHVIVRASNKGLFERMIPAYFAK